MHWNFAATLERFQKKSLTPVLRQGLFGFEKENLRITPEGQLALTPHPKRLGSSLTHPHITTDFSESQIEMITAPFATMEAAFAHLHELENEVLAALENGEMLWPLSMPCRLPATEMIPIARYGDTPEAKRREQYRQGLAVRYGKMMQMVSGMHYNFSFTPEFWTALREMRSETDDLQNTLNEGYLHLARNFLRERWKLVYLFGASPLRDPSYTCKAMKPSTEAISLRLSRCGYSNPAKIDIRYNRFEDHVNDLRTAVSTPYPPYATLEGQLNDHLLQIANEFYAPIRLKPPRLLNGDLLHSLETLGAGYVEVRILDLNPFTPCGITLDQAYLLHLFLVACALNDSPPLSEQERMAWNDVQEEIALHGQALSEQRKQALLNTLEGLKPLAEELGPRYESALEYHQKEIHHPTTLPWIRLLASVPSNDPDAFLKFGLEKAHAYTQR